MYQEKGKKSKKRPGKAQIFFTVNLVTWLKGSINSSPLRPAICQLARCSHYCQSYRLDGVQLSLVGHPVILDLQWLNIDHSSKIYSVVGSTKPLKGQLWIIIALTSFKLKQYLFSAGEEVNARSLRYQQQLLYCPPEFLRLHQDSSPTAHSDLVNRQSGSGGVFFFGICLSKSCFSVQLRSVKSFIIPKKVAIINIFMTNNF